MHEGVSGMDLGELRMTFMTLSLQAWMPAAQCFKSLSQQQRFRINPKYKKVLYQRSGQEAVYWGDPGCIHMHKIAWPL